MSSIKGIAVVLGLWGVLTTAWAEEVGIDQEPPSAMDKITEGRSPDAVPAKGGASATNEKTTLLPEGYVEKVFEGKTKVEGTVQARRKLIDEATFKVSEELVRSILGEARYKKNKAVIADKVFRQSSRYVPVIKTGELVSGDDGQKLTVTLQVNTKVLEALLQEQGVFSDNENSPMMIPWISIDDQIRGESYAWWRPQNSNTLKGMAEFLESHLQKTLFSMGFYVQRPGASHLQLLVPSGYQNDSLSTEQIQGLSQRWGVPLAMTGGLSIRRDGNSETLLELRLAVTQVGTGRVLAQLLRQNKLSRQETLENLNLKKSLAFVLQAYKDLGQQMSDAWQRGVLTSNLVILELRSALPVNKYEAFKEALKASHRSIRQVRERMITSQSVIFEIDINGDPKEIVGSLQQIKAGDLGFRLKGYEGGTVLVMVPMQSRFR